MEQRFVPGIHASGYGEFSTDILAVLRQRIGDRRPNRDSEKFPNWNSHEIIKLARRPYGASRCAGQGKNTTERSKRAYNASVRN